MTFRAYTFTLGKVLIEGTRTQAEQAADRFVKSCNVGSLPEQQQDLPGRRIFGILFSLGNLPRFVPQVIVEEVKESSSFRPLKDTEFDEKLEWLCQSRRALIGRGIRFQLGDWRIAIELAARATPEQLVRMEERLAEEEDAYPDPKRKGHA